MDRPAGSQSALHYLRLRLAGLVDPAWPVGVVGGRDDGTLHFTNLSNPPVTVSESALDRRVSQRCQLEIFFDEELLLNQSILLHPPTALRPGLQDLECLAALVTPHNRNVAEQVRRARERLGEPHSRQGFPRLLPGATAKALYLQLMRAGEINYAWEPGPWTGIQVIRSVDSIVREGQATCVDLALLFCSMIEHVRQLPILIGTSSDGQRWHVLPAIRLRETDGAASPLVLDREAILTACATAEISVYDPEALFAKQPPEEAGNLAISRLHDSQQAFLIDVQCCRDSGILPLPTAAPVTVESFDVAWDMRVRPPQSSGAIPQELFEEASHGRLVVILGDVLDPVTGVSRDELARKISFAANRNECDLLAAGTVLENKVGRSEVEKLVQEILLSKGEHSENYRVFGRIPLEAIISLHPDAQMETALRSISPPFQVMVEDDDLARIERSPHGRDAYLLAGSALSRRGLLLTPTDCQRLRHRIEILARGLRDRLANKTLLILNYDFSDTTLLDFYLEATRHLNRTRPVYVSNVRNCEIQNRCVVSLPCHEILQKLADFFTTPRLHRKLKIPRAAKLQVPYKYLDYFGIEDADIFFGRERDIDLIAREILASPMGTLVLCGRSGVGKTSLVKAGLMPRLMKNEKMVAIYARCGLDPAAAIVKELSRSNFSGNTAAGSMREAFSHFVAECSRELVVFVDQMEEAFFKVGHEQLAAFFSEVRDCVSGPAALCRIVFVIRADFLGRLAIYRTQFPGLLSTACTLRELSSDDAREAIVRPAEKCGLAFEPDLLDQMLEDLRDDVSEDRILPAHLQVVCDRMYRESREQGTFRLAIYEKLGRAAQLLRRHFHESLETLPSEQRRTARAILKTLVTSEKTRDLLSISEIAGQTNLPERIVAVSNHQMIHELRLMREVSGDPLRFELAHESLAESIGEWLEEADLKRKQLQEILQQQVSDAKKGFEFPSDKLKLLDEHREELALDSDSTREVVKAFIQIGELPDYWRLRLATIPRDDYLGIFANGADLSSGESIVDTLCALPEEIFCQIPPLRLPEAVSRAVARQVVDGDSEMLRRRLQLAALDATHQTPLDIARILQSHAAPKVGELLIEIEQAWGNLAVSGKLGQELVRLGIRSGYLSPLISQSWFDMNDRDFYVTLFGKINSKRVDDVRIVLRQLSPSFLKLLPMKSCPVGLAATIADTVLHGSPDTLQTGIMIAFLDSSERIRSRIVKKLSSVTRLHAVRIARHWDEPTSEEVQAFEYVLGTAPVLRFLYERLAEQAKALRFETKNIEIGVAGITKSSQTEEGGLTTVERIVSGLVKWILDRRLYQLFQVTLLTGELDVRFLVLQELSERAVNEELPFEFWEFLSLQHKTFLHASNPYRYEMATLLGVCAPPDLLVPLTREMSQVTPNEGFDTRKMDGACTTNIMSLLTNWNSTEIQEVVFMRFEALSAHNQIPNRVWRELGAGFHSLILRAHPCRVRLKNLILQYAPETLVTRGKILNTDTN